MTAWPAPVHPARDALCASIRKELTGSGVAGAVLVGPSGTGKSALLERVIANLPESVCCIRVRGSAVAAETPFGALGFLLAGCSDADLLQPAAVLRALFRVLADTAAGRTLLISVDNLRGLDLASAAALAQLARTGHIRLLVAASDCCSSDAWGSAEHCAPAQEFLRLWADGQLVRFDLEPQPQPPPLPSSLEPDQESNVAPPAETAAARLHGTTPGQARIIDMLALAVEMPVRTLRQLAPVQELDELQERGWLQLVPGRLPLMRLSDPVLRDAVRLSVPAGRSSQLWSELSAVLAADQIPAGAVRGMAAWSIACGRAPDPDLARHAARQANAAGCPAEAVRFVRAVPPPSRQDPGLALEAARALMALGEPAAAAVSIREALARGVPGHGHWVRLMVALHRAVRCLPGQEADAGRVLDGLRSALAGWQAENNDAGLAGLRMQVAVAAADYAAYRGCYREVEQHLGSIAEDHRTGAAAPFEATRFEAAALLAETWALLGRREEAGRAAEGLERSLGDGAVPPEMENRVLACVALVRFLCGDWNGDGISAVPMPDVPTGDGGSLTTGLLHAAAGRSTPALQALLPAVERLKDCDPDGLLPLAHAAAAWAARTQPDTAQQVGMVPDLAGPQDSWLVQAATAYFRILAGSAPQPAGSAWQSSQAAAGFVRLADAARHRGLAAVEPVFLAAAAAQGSQPAARRLLAAAGRGPFPEAHAAYAVGLLHDNGAALLRAAELAAAAGNNLLACQAAAAAQSIAGARQDRALARSARAALRAGYRSMNGQGADQLEGLSGFELRLAAGAADGRSSAALGPELNLSPRTVEWHLGRIFEKLHVSSRAELRAVLAGSGLINGA